ncbi:uncharacterized protein LOC124187822 [Neodiprion fabricii]|uniref:uncharacterized protein LOC124187822 n=1 Tax=Neodiprion fabricii TaxID=2872261 RepID=UPI001ED921D5|nr:uncharacterized protein LOC124187822 [Neodiprion fabricii]
MGAETPGRHRDAEDLINGRDKGVHARICHEASAGIILINKKTQAKTIRTGKGYVIVKIGKTMGITSMSFSPNKRMAEFVSYWDEVVIETTEAASKQGISIILAGDLNAWAQAWGGTKENPRESVIVDTMNTHGWSCLNVGKIPTFHRGEATSIIDITIAMQAVAKTVTGWRVIKDIEAMSDHRRIEFRIMPVKVGNGNTGCDRPRDIPDWNMRTTSKEKLRNAMVQMRINTKWQELRAPELQREIIRLIVDSLNRVAKRRTRCSGKPPVYWWTGDITKSRTSCTRARRILQRARKRRKSEAFLEKLTTELREARKKLKTLIRQSKERAWNELLAQLEADPWGRSYKIITGKLAGPGPLAPAYKKDAVKAVEELFPPGKTHPKLTLKEIDRVVEETDAKTL